LADTSDEDMFTTFNMGLGMVLVAAEAADAVAVCRQHGLEAVVVGRVTAEPGVRFR
jgi:phosphoribosylaminoimidazole (AIR) synthetase